MRFFWGGHFEFSKSAILIFFFCFISVKNLALLFEVSFFSALWMVLPESWKRLHSNSFAHDCITNSSDVFNNLFHDTFPQFFSQFVQLKKKRFLVASCPSKNFDIEKWWNSVVFFWLFSEFGTKFFYVPDFFYVFLVKSREEFWHVSMFFKNTCVF